MSSLISCNSTSQTVLGFLYFIDLPIVDTSYFICLYLGLLLKTEALANLLGPLQYIIPYHKNITYLLSESSIRCFFIH